MVVEIIATFYFSVNVFISFRLHCHLMIVGGKKPHRTLVGECVWKLLTRNDQFVIVDNWVGLISRQCAPPPCIQVDLTDNGAIHLNHYVSFTCNYSILNMYGYSVTLNSIRTPLIHSSKSPVFVEACLRRSAGSSIPVTLTHCRPPHKYYNPLQTWLVVFFGRS